MCVCVCVCVCVDRLTILSKEFNTSHRTSPFIYEGCDLENQKVIGGYTDFAKRVKETYKLNVPLDWNKCREFILKKKGGLLDNLYNEWEEIKKKRRCFDLLLDWC